MRPLPEAHDRSPFHEEVLLRELPHRGVLEAEAGGEMMFTKCSECGCTGTLHDRLAFLEAEVARLTEERREKEITIDALRDRGDEYRDECDQRREEIARLTEERAELVDGWDRRFRQVEEIAKGLLTERDRQRGDIQRLVGLADIALTWMPDNDRRRMLVTLLAEMKERYG